MVMGIYKLYNIVNNNTYVGQSKNIDSRIEWHKQDLINNKHHQKNLQKEFNGIVRALKRKYEDTRLKDYILYGEYVFDNVYKYEILEEFIDFHSQNNEAYKNYIEDKYILEYRNIQEGYKQYTNKEIKEYRDSKDPKIPIRDMDSEKLELTYLGKTLYCNDVAYSTNPYVCILAHLIIKDKQEITIEDIKYSLWWTVVKSGSTVKEVIGKFKRCNIVKYESDIKWVKLKVEDIFKIEILWSENLINDIIKLFDELNIKYEIR